MRNISTYIPLYFSTPLTLLLLFFVSVFLLPSNLFLVARLPESYIQGHFVDYLAPKLYLQQLVLWLFLGLWALKSRDATRGKTHYRPILQRFSLRKNVGLLLLSMGLVSIGVRSVLHADWGLLSLLFNFLTGPILLLLFLWKEKQFAHRYLASAILVTVVFQASLALWQWFNQDSLFGYWFLGEPNLRLPDIAQATFSGAVRPLPYGTTPHPNILGGWLVLGIISAIAWIRSQKLLIPMLALLLAALLLTESWTAWISLLFLLGYQLIGRRCALGKFSFPPLSLTLQKVSLVLLFLIVQIGWYFVPQILAGNPWTAQVIDSPSLTRRVHLNEVTLQRLQNNPQGSDFRMMFQSIFEEENSYQGARFLQPAHNSSLLLVTITGIWIIILFSLFCFSAYTLYSFYFAILLTSLPIFTLDHYILSTISGQYLGILFLVFFTHYFFNRLS